MTNNNFENHVFEICTKQMKTNFEELAVLLTLYQTESTRLMYRINRRHLQNVH